jgi:hypothetical protein
VLAKAVEVHTAIDFDAEIVLGQVEVNALEASFNF